MIFCNLPLSIENAQLYLLFEMQLGHSRNLSLLILPAPLATESSAVRQQPRPIYKKEKIDRLLLAWTNQSRQTHADTDKINI